MIKTFADKHTQAFFEDGICHRQWRSFEKQAARKLDMLNNVDQVEHLRIPPSNRLEKLKGKRSDEWSIRINDQWRVCFRWEGEHAYDVAIEDYH